MDWYPPYDKEPQYYIDLTLEFDYEQRDIAAERVKHLVNIGESQRYSDYELGVLNDAIDTFLNIIVGEFGFEVVGEEQSSKSYAYYINFIPKDADGNVMDDWMVRARFRIADHPLAVGRGRDSFSGKGVFFRSFVYGNERYQDPMSLSAAIEKTCFAIQNRDSSGLYKY